MESSPGPRDELYLREHIRDALAQDPRTGELELTVQLAPGKVSITGVVGSEERRRAVEEVVSELCPDRELHNGTRVVGTDPAEQMEDLS